MHVKNIELENFRNYETLKTAFGKGINVITGNNAQGKTNLLEAIYYLCGARSFRTRKDKELIKFSKSYAKIESTVFSDMRDVDIRIMLNTEERKQIFVNSVKKRTASDLSGRLCSILFCPEDLEIVKGAAAERRKFMDLAICQLRPKYAAALSEFNRLYDHKIRILRDYKEKPSLLHILDDFNSKLCIISTELIYYRAAWCRKLSSGASALHTEISSGSEELDVKYKPVSAIENPENMRPAQIHELLEEHQAKHRQAEIDSGLCLSGAHKDDIIISINNKNAKSFASQGQIRTCALSLKLAERQICYNDTGEYPILLLDDILSELDGKRQEFVLNKISGGQIFITCCEIGDIKEKTNENVIKIESGRII